MTSQMLRKSKSEKKLETLSVPINKFLPYVEAEKHIEIRSKE